MKKALKITGIVLAVLLVAAAGLLWWQRDNLRAVSLSFRHSGEELTQMKEESRQRVESAAQAIEGVTVRDLTPEEKAALAADEVSREEIIARLTAKPAASEPTEAEPAGTEASVPAAAGAVESAEAPAADSLNASAEQPTLEDQLAALLAEIYVMQSEYTTWLEQKYAAAIEEYAALDEDQRTTSAKYNIGMSYMQEALAKEDECDARMETILGQISELLTQMGRDQSLVSDIQTAYDEEKAATKAYYLGLHD